MTISIFKSYAAVFMVALFLLLGPSLFAASSPEKEEILASHLSSLLGNLSIDHINELLLKKKEEELKKIFPDEETVRSLMVLGQKYQTHKGIRTHRKNKIGPINEVLEVIDIFAALEKLVTNKNIASFAYKSLESYGPFSSFQADKNALISCTKVFVSTDYDEQKSNFILEWSTNFRRNSYTPDYFDQIIQVIQNYVLGLEHAKPDVLLLERIYKTLHRVPDAQVVTFLQAKLNKK